MTHDEEEPQGPLEIALVGDLTEHAADLADKLLGVPPGGSCTMYFDSPGGSPYCALALMTLMVLRRVEATGVVAGECSSAALWPLAACRTRLVTPYSVLLFHPMKWQSEEHVHLAEAAEWARHFEQLERQMDTLLARMFGLPEEQLAEWIRPGRYISGTEFAEAGLGQLVDLVAVAKSPQLLDRLAPSLFRRS